MSSDLEYYLFKAEKYLGSARLLAETEYSNGAITDSYYAFFWIIRGLLYEKGIITKRHSGLKQMFNLHYIVTGEIPKRYYDELEELFQRRQLVDYGGDEDFPLSEVEACINTAEIFLTYVKTTYA
jgi:uncharacterized protein (UPF0332 family)